MMGWWLVSLVILAGLFFLCSYRSRIRALLYSASILVLESNQQQCATNCMDRIRKNAIYLRRALDSNNPRDVINYSAQVLFEVQADSLLPRYYSLIYTDARIELEQMEMFFKDDNERIRIISVYEEYQRAKFQGMVLPRLYLLCIFAKFTPRAIVAKKLLRMSLVIKDPIHGLFLRRYVLEAIEVISKCGESCTIMDAVDFVLENFTEANKLWLRWQPQPSVLDCYLQSLLNEKDKRKERCSMQDEVGKNLRVLSQMKGVSLKIYGDVVLPRVLNQILNSKDDLAQVYLMDCIIEYFPADYNFHLRKTLLGVCRRLQDVVDQEKAYLENVISKLMEKLRSYAASNPNAE